jgi:hypothetical protein
MFGAPFACESIIVRYYTRMCRDVQKLFGFLHGFVIKISIFYGIITAIPYYSRVVAAGGIPVAGYTDGDGSKPLKKSERKAPCEIRTTRRDFTAKKR